MQERKFSVMIARFPYGGNGGTSSEVPDVGDWLALTYHKLKTDQRISEVNLWRESDTPIPMVRNKAVRDAIEAKADFLIIIDSDMFPDYEYRRGRPGAKLFMDVALDHLVANYDKGPSMIAAPYCGPPPHENVYVFQAACKESEHASECDFRIAQFTREEAARKTGTEQVMALPTGLMAIDLRVFQHLPPPWFDYEYADHFQSAKASTEDCVFTRDAFLFMHRKGFNNPLYVAWDCWAGHWKPKCVGAPVLLMPENISQRYIQAATRQAGRSLEVGGNAMDDAITPTKPEIPPASPPPAKQPFQPQVFEDGGMDTSQQDIDELLTIICEAKQRCIQLQRPLTVVEVGSFVGRTALAIESKFTAGDRLLCVDTWEGSIADSPAPEFDSMWTRINKLGGPDEAYKMFCRNLGDRLDSTVFAWRMPSAQAAQQFLSKADVVFIDAEHSYESCKADIEAWAPRLVPWGVMCGHDYNIQAFPGVCRAVMEFAAANNYPIQIKGTVWSMVFEPANEAEEPQATVAPSQPHQNASLLASMLDVLREDRRLQIDSRPIRVACWPHGTLKASLNGADAADIVDAANPWDADLLVNAAPHDSDTFLAEATRFARHGTIIVGQGSHPVGPNTQGEERDGFWAQRILRAPNGANPMECVGLVQVR